MLILSNMLLLDGTVLPKSHLDFLSYHNTWKMEHRFWEEKQVPYSWQARSPWPKKFDEDIAASYARLKTRHAELLGRPAK